VRQKPRRLVRDLQRPVQLMRRHALFAGAHQIRRLQHFMQRHTAMLENRSDLARELLAAGVAFPEADPRAFALEFARLINNAAMRTTWAVRPQNRL